MAVTDERWTLAEATWPQTDPGRVALAYDPPTDTLFADLFGGPVPAVTEPLDGTEGTVSLRIRLDGDEVVGIMVEGYVKRAVKLYAHWRELAAFAGSAMEALRAAGGAASLSGDRTAIVDRFLADVKTISAANIEAMKPAIAG